MDNIDVALNHLKEGKMIVVVDDETRENEGDLICPASMITSEQVNFMARFGRGLICVALPPVQIQRLGLPLMERPEGGGDAFGTAFTYSIDAKEGVSTGISAEDRAITIRLAVDPTTTPKKLAVPGHIFPLKAKAGGVLERRGHTEAAVDLTQLSGLIPGGVICEILNENGTMMRLPDLKIFAQQHNLPLISIKQLVEYRLNQEVKSICQTVLPTPWGAFNQRIYHDTLGREHVLLWLGSFTKKDKPLVRVHSECLTGDIFESLRCDCGSQLKQSLQLIHQEGAGILIYLRQEGRGIGLTEKIKAYSLQDQGMDTVEANQALGHAADLRSYEVVIKMLSDLMVERIRLLTNNPYKIHYLQQHSIHVDRIPTLVETNQHNVRYQQSKADKLGHLIPLSSDPIVPSLAIKKIKMRSSNPNRSTKHNVGV